MRGGSLLRKNGSFMEREKKEREKKEREKKASVTRGHANLQSTVREAPVRSIFRQHFFFPFLEFFCRFLRKINSDNFLWVKKNFKVKNWLVEKI